ncbi:ABC transporter substrate-binding protein [Streptomyces sp. NPDC001658]
MNSPLSASRSLSTGHSTFTDRALSRRTLLTSVGALGLGGLLTACGGSDDEPADGRAGASTSGGPWTFKDDRGTTIRTDSTPKRIVAFVGAAAVLHDFGIECVGVFGPTKLENGEPDPRAGGIDVNKVTILGNTYPQFNVERYAALRPDLLVAQMTDPPALWYVPEESAKKIESLAPSVGILTTKSSLTKVIDRFTELAASLGADVKSAELATARTIFETASAHLRRAATRSSGRLKVMAISAAPDLMYVANPDDFTDLRYYKSLGVDFVTPAKLSEGGFWHQLSWENADTYDADVILVDNRPGTLQPADLAKAEPTWARLPAVRAKQIFPWVNEERFSHAGYGPRIDSLAAALEKSKKTAA